MINKKSKSPYALVFTLVLLMAISAMIFTLLNKDVVESAFQPRSRQKSYIVVIGKSDYSAFWISVASGARAAAAEYNLDMNFVAPESEENFEAQNAMIRAAITGGAKAIIFSAIDYNGNADAINEAIAAGIPVIVIDSDVNSDGVVCRIMTDNYMAGRMAGEQAVANNPGELTVGIVNYDINSANGQQREQGFCDAVRESGRVKDIYTVNCVSTEDSAYEGTCELLAEHPEINTIAALNELMSLGSGYAIRDLGLEDEVDIYAFDSNAISVSMLETGEIDGLVVQNPYAMGYLGVETAYNIMNGHGVQSGKIDTTTIFVSESNMYDIDIQRMIFRFDDRTR
ncbi:MAG: substrate-binding domain-containing protein [Saccharofermentans sp.]|nr:substrate-binding domain-containing protein [Saccharofermentans sp.]